MAFCDFLRPKDKEKNKPERDRHPDDTFDVSSAFIKGTFLINPYFKRRLEKIAAAELTKFFEHLQSIGIQPGTADDMEELILKYGESPGQISKCLAEILWLPEIAMLDNGFSDLCMQMLVSLGEPVRRIDTDFNPGDLIHRQNVLVLPTGGLDGLGKSTSFKRRMEEYVRAGGRVIALCQFRGEDFSALPLKLNGYGWQEDQSCHTHSMRIAKDHPILSGQVSFFMDISCDGYFTQWPDTSSILLRRAAHDRPCLLYYPFDKGLVIAASAFMDWAFGHQQSTNEEVVLMRDLIGFAKCGENLPEYDPDDKEISMELKVANPTEIGAEGVQFTLIDPDKNILNESYNLIEKFELLDERHWEKNGADIINGRLQLKGTGSSYNSNLYYDSIFPRKDNIIFKVVFSIECDPAIETSFHITAENDKEGDDYRRYGIICKSSRIVWQTKTESGWHEDILMSGLAGRQDYTAELLFEEKKSLLYIYNSSETRPQAPNHILEGGNWDPRLHLWICNGKAAIREISINRGGTGIFRDTFEKTYLSDGYIVNLATLGQNKMKLRGTSDNSWQSAFYGKDVFNRRTCPVFKCEVMLEDVNVDTNFHVSAESPSEWGNPDYRRHGVVFIKNTVRLQKIIKDSDQAWTEIYSNVEAKKKYIVEIEFDTNESRLFFYPADKEKPSQPNDVFNTYDWSPRLRFTIRDGKAEVTGIKIERRSEPVITVIKPIKPGGDETIKLAFAGHLKQGIWRMDAALLDKDKKPIYTHYSLARFSVDNFDHISSGVAYKTVPMQFSVTSRDEETLEGNQNLFTIHIWSNDNVKRSIKVCTRFNHNSFYEEKTVEIAAKGYGSTERQLPALPPDKHTFWVVFKDENGKELGEMNKEFRISGANIDMQIVSNQKELLPGKKLNAELRLKTQGNISFPANIQVALLDPRNRAVIEKSYDSIQIKAFEDTVVPLEIDAPEQLGPGDYQLTASVSYKARELQKKGMPVKAALKGGISGYLLDSIHLKPIKGATMALNQGDNYIQLDESGFFSSEADAGFQTLIARASGYSDNDTKVIVNVSQNTIIRNILMCPLTGKVNGKICNLISGAGIAGVNITLSVKSAVTSEDGSFAFENVSIGMKSMQVNHPDFAELNDISFNLEAGKEESFPQIGLRPVKGTLSGKAVNSASGKNIPGAKVWGDGIEAVEAGKDGEFILEGIPEGRRGFYCEAPGFRQNRAVLEIMGGRDTNIKEFFLQPTQGRVSGAVLDGVSNRPVKDAIVWGDGFESIKTGMDGGFITPMLPLQVLKVGVKKEGYKEAFAKVRVFPEREVKMETLWIKPINGRVKGFVKDRISQKPIENSILKIDNLKAISDQKGEFVFDAVPEGLRWLSCIVPDERRKEYAEEVTLQFNIFAGQETDLGDLFLNPAAGYVEGRVEEALSSKPAGNAVISMAGTTVKTDDKGEFLLSAPAGRYCGTVRPGQGDYENRFCLDIREGRIIKLENIKLTNGKARIYGSIKEKPERTDFSEVYIGLSENGLTGVMADGSFSFENVSEGTKTIWIKIADRIWTMDLKNPVPGSSINRIEIIYEAGNEKPVSIEHTIQQIQVKGRILDMCSGSPIQGVEIIPDDYRRKDSYIIQRSNIFGGDPAGGCLGTSLMLKGRELGEGIFCSKTYAEDNDGLGFVFKYKDEKNFHRLFMLDEGGGFCRLERWENGVCKILATGKYIYPKSRWFEVKIVMEAGRVKIYVDGRPIFNISAAANDTGRIGFMCYGQVNQLFSSISLKSLKDEPIYEEDFRHGLENWEIVDDGTQEAPSVWEAAPSKKAVTDANGEFSMVLSPGKHILFAYREGFRTIDAKSREILAYGFYGDKPLNLELYMSPENCKMSGILLDAATGKPVSDAYVWADDADMAEGGLLQRSNIYTSAPDTFSGTRLVTKENTWDSYDFTLQMKASDNDGIGLLFRYRDADNYYRVLMLKQDGSFIRLEKMQEGKLTILDRKDGDYPQNIWFTMTISINGNRIFIKQDNKIVFDIADGGIASGGIGLECSGQENQWFRQIYVKAPTGEILLDETNYRDFGRWDIIDTGDAEGPSAWEGYPDKRSRTGEEGRFHLETLPPGEHKIYFNKAGYSSFDGSLLMNIRTNAGMEYKKSFFIKPVLGTVEGIVRDAVSLKPLYGVRIRINSMAREVLSGKNGSFFLEGIPADENIDLHAFMDGYSTGDGSGWAGSWRVESAVKSRVDLYMQAERSSFVLEVRDHTSDKHVSGVVGRLEGTGLNSISLDAGLINIANIPLGVRTLTLISEKYMVEKAAIEFEALSGCENKMAIYLRPATGYLQGIINDISSGEPVKNIQVLVNDGSISAISGSSGNYSLELAEGWHRVYFVSDTYSSNTGVEPAYKIYVNGGGDTEIKTRLSRTTGQITGVLTDGINDKVVPNARIILDAGWLQTSSGQDGRYRLSVPPGKHQVFARASNYFIVNEESGLFLETNIYPGQELDIEASLNPGTGKAEFAFTDLPEAILLINGKPCVVSCKIINTGKSAGSEMVKLIVSGIGLYEQNKWLNAGEEAEVHFTVHVPQDLLESENQEACFVLGEIRKFISVRIEGIKIKVSAKLDKDHYADGETAKLRIQVQNLSNESMQIFAITRFNKTTQRSEVKELRDYAAFDFNIAVEHGNGKLFYGIYSESSRALALNTLYIYPTDRRCLLKCNKDSYRTGEKIKFTIKLAENEAPRKIQLYLTSPESHEILSEAKELDINSNTETASELTIPSGLESGTYALTVTAEGLEYDHPVDIRTISLLVRRVDLNKNQYEYTDDFKAELELEADEGITGLIEYKWLNTKGEQIDSASSNIKLEKGINIFRPSNNFRTCYSGSHTFLYKIYSYNGENSEMSLLTIGSKLFDVSGNVITAMYFDSEKVSPGKDNKLKVVMHGQGESKLKLLLNGKKIREEKVTLHQRTVAEYDVRTEMEGRNLLVASLNGDTHATLLYEFWTL